MSSIRLAAGAAAAIAFAASAQAEGVVNVYNWSDYIDESVLEAFTAETGVKVVYDVFDTNEILETKLLAGGTGYDIVVPTGTFLARQISAGVFQPLQKDKLPNLKNMWEAVSSRTAKYDPDNKFSINYMWGTTGIGYNVGKIQERLGADFVVDSWSLVFDPAIAAKVADCGVMMLDAPDEIFRAALRYLGLDPNSASPDDYRKATDLLLSVRPSIQKFHSSEYINGLANGEICVAVGYSGDIFQARDRAAEANNGVTVNYVIPKEGANMWFDQMAIPADAPNVENAHKFLDFLMRPEMIAKASNFTFYANGNLASKELLDEAVKGDPAIYPTDEVVNNLFVASPLDAGLQRQVTRMWSQVRTGS
jgi:putrescine transport system substrate-binding protein